MRRAILVTALCLAAGMAWVEARAAAPKEEFLVTEQLAAAIREAAPAAPLVKPAAARKVLVYGRWPTHPESVACCFVAMEAIGRKTGAFEAVASGDPAVFEPESLRQFDAVVMNNTHERFPMLPLDFDELDKAAQEAALAREEIRKKSLLDFVAGGKGIVGVHGAVAGGVRWPEYLELLNGAYGGHFTEEVWVKSVEPEHPLCAPLGGRSFDVTDEIYMFKEPHDAAKARLLMSLDLEKMADPGRNPEKYYPVSWVREYGKGRVFYCSLGHFASAYTTPEVLLHYLAGIQFAIGDLEADASLPTKGEAAGTLDVYFLDMMGGASTLIVTPLGESVLIDTGSREPSSPVHRDAERILRAARLAGLRQIDFLVTTHFHSDHFGGIHELTRRIPVKKFLDKGHLPPEKESQREPFQRLYQLYREATGGKVEPLGPGDDLPLRNDPTGKLPPLRLHCVAAEMRIEGFEGDVDAAVPGFEIRPADESDNARSIALVLSYGRFELFAGGDITWNVEHHLAVPENRVGEVDVYQVTHHGLDQSNNPVLLKALAPSVCIAMNGPRKGIQPNTLLALGELPSVEAIYAIHYNTQYGDEGNPPLDFIANGKDPDKARFVKLSVRPDEGTFTVGIDVDGPRRTYHIE